MDYPSAKFGDFTFSRFGFIMQTDRITEADERYTEYWRDLSTVGVSNNSRSSIVFASSAGDGSLFVKLWYYV